MEPRSQPTGQSSAVTRPDRKVEPRQRWRVVHRVAAGAPATLRERGGGWESAVMAAGLPSVGLEADPPRPRILFGPPLPPGVAGERELVDFLLSACLPVADVRERLVPCLPTGVTLLDLHDVWLGLPSLAADVIGAVYAVRVEPSVEPDVLAAAARDLLEATTLPRTRAKGDRTVSYDLRPLLTSISVPDLGPDGPTILEIGVRLDPNLGVGRPEEVVAALGARLGRDVTAVEMVRAGLVCASEQR